MYQPTLTQTLSVAGFGILGVLARYFLGPLGNRFFSPFPSGTFAINLIGAFLAGLLFTVLTERIPSDLRIGILVGFLGGFTTFSSYSLESARLLETGSTAVGMLYLVLSPALGLASCLAGLGLGRALTGGSP